MSNDFWWKAVLTHHTRETVHDPSAGLYNICANECRVSPWTADTADQILIGDAMYAWKTKPFPMQDTVTDLFTRSITFVYDDS